MYVLSLTHRTAPARRATGQQGVNVSELLESLIPPESQRAADEADRAQATDLHQQMTTPMGHRVVRLMVELAEQRARADAMDQIAAELALTIHRLRAKLAAAGIEL